MSTQTQKTSAPESRRRALRTLAVTGGVAVAGAALPGKWTRPVVDAVMLPAHAQTSTPSPVAIEASGIRAASEMRAPSGGGGSVESISLLRIQGCADQSGPVSMTATADMNPSGNLVLGTVTSTATAGAVFQLALSVPGSQVIPIANINRILLDITINGTTTRIVLSGATVSSILAGPAAPHVCSL